MSDSSKPPAAEGEGTAPPSSPVAWLLGAGVLLAGLVLAMMGQEAPVRIARGVDAPEFSLPRLEGATPGAPTALSDLRGKVVLVNFWATWCKPCEDEMPSMERLYRGLDGESFEMLAVSVDDDPATVEAFRARMALSFPILFDPAQSVSRQYQTTGFPESLLIDPAGRVVERYVGPRAWDDPAYVERIRSLIRAGA